MAKERTMMRRGLLAMAGSLLALGAALPVAANEGSVPDDWPESSRAFALEHAAARLEGPDGIEWTAFLDTVDPVAVDPVAEGQVTIEPVAIDAAGGSNDGDMASLGVEWTRLSLRSGGSVAIDGVEWTLPR